MVDYVNTFDQLGAELRNMRKLYAVWEHKFFSDNANFSKRLIDAEYDSSVNVEDAAKVAQKALLQESIADSVASGHEDLKAGFEENFFPVLDDELVTAQADINAGAISYTYTITTDGQVSISERLGRWGALRRAMVNDSQTILENTVTIGALTALAGNIGNAVKTSGTGEDHALAGTLVLRVVDDTVGAVKFEVENQLTKQLIDGTTIIQSDNFGKMTLGQSFEDGQTGTTIQLDLDSAALAETGDNNNLFSLVTITDLTESNSTRGTIFIRITRQSAAPIWLIEWFSDAALENLVKSGTLDGTVGSEAITLTDTANGSSWTATLDKAAADAALGSPGDKDDDISYDIKSPRIGDRWTMPVTNDEAGNFATKLARRYRASLNSDGAPTITDADAASVTVT